MTVSKVLRIVKIAFVVSIITTLGGWAFILWNLVEWFIGTYELPLLLFAVIISSMIMGMCAGVLVMIKSLLKYKMWTLEQILP
jgi:hypothetical protein